MHPRWHLSHALGYFELGLIDAAADELALLPPQWMDKPEVLGLQAFIIQERKEWFLLQPLARQLVLAQPENPGWWILWAYAARRADSLTSANAILRDAELQHPSEATIQFNLGCYACQLGQLDEAKRRVERAISLEKAFAESAQTDTDLEPLRLQGWSPPGPQSHPA